MVKLPSIVALAIISACSLAVAQEKKIEHVKVSPTSAASGKEMYLNYCAVCHGKDGKGGGPAAEALKVSPGVGPDFLEDERWPRGGSSPARQQPEPVSGVVTGEIAVGRALQKCLGEKESG